MAQQTDATDDPRTTDLTIEMAEAFDSLEHEYRDGVNYEGSEVVYEDDQMVIVADRTGHELNQYLNGHDVPRRVISSWMHDVARDKTDRDWSAADPIVFDRLED